MCEKTQDVKRKTIKNQVKYLSANSANSAETWHYKQYTLYEEATLS